MKAQNQLRSLFYGNFRERNGRKRYETENAARKCSTFAASITKAQKQTFRITDEYKK